MAKQISLSVDDKSSKLLLHLNENKILNVKDDQTLGKGEGKVEVKGTKVVLSVNLRHASAMGFPIGKQK